MSIWTVQEREEINKTIMYEEDLYFLACNAYDQCKNEGKKLKDILKQPKYKELTDYYDYDTIINDVLKYYII